MMPPQKNIDTAVAHTHIFERLLSDSVDRETLSHLPFHLIPSSSLIPNQIPYNILRFGEVHSSSSSSFHFFRLLCLSGGIADWLVELATGMNGVDFVTH